MADMISIDNSFHSQSQSPFFNKLPTELRLRVYEFAFASGPGYLKLPHDKSTIRKLTAPLYTCKRIYVEAEEAIFKRNIFSYSLMDSWNSSLLSTIESTYLRKIRHLEIVIGSDYVMHADYQQEVSRFFEMFNSGGIHLRSLRLCLVGSGCHNINTVEEALLEFRGVKVSGPIAIASWFLYGNCSPIIDEHEEDIVRAIRNGSRD